GAAEDEASALAEHREISPGVDHTGGTARSLQCFERAIDGIALRDSAKIDMDALPDSHAMRLHEFHITHAARSLTQARVEGALRACVQDPAQLQHLPCPRVQLERLPSLAARQRREIAAVALRVHRTIHRGNGI